MPSPVAAAKASRSNVPIKMTGRTLRRADMRGALYHRPAGALTETREAAHPPAGRRQPIGPSAIRTGRAIADCARNRPPGTAANGKAAEIGRAAENLEPWDLRLAVLAVAKMNRNLDKLQPG